MHLKLLTDTIAFAFFFFLRVSTGPCRNSCGWSRHVRVDWSGGWSWRRLPPLSQLGCATGWGRGWRWTGTRWVRLAWFLHLKNTNKRHDFKRKDNHLISNGRCWVTCSAVTKYLHTSLMTMCLNIYSTSVSGLVLFSHHVEGFFFFFIWQKCSLGIACNFEVKKKTLKKGGRFFTFWGKKINKIAPSVKGILEFLVLS